MLWEIFLSGNWRLVEFGFAIIGFGYMLGVLYNILLEWKNEYWLQDKEGRAAYMRGEKRT